jgi:hypothetical protein
MRLQSFGGFGIILGIPEPIPRSTTMNELSRTEARDLARCEDVIERGLHTFLEVGTALSEIRDRRLYRATHDTFDAYCRERWDMSRQRANQLIDAVKVVSNLTTVVVKPPSERVARALAALPPAEQPKVWAHAVEAAKGGKVTTAHVRRAVQKVRYANRPDPPPCGPNYEVIQGDAEHMDFPDLHVDLVVGSPPYTNRRIYLSNGQDTGISRETDEWIEWMLRVTRECLRVSRGLVCWVVGSKMEGWTYEPACEGLAYRWWREGGSAFPPCYWHRVGIPGSGTDQWYRADVEIVLCFKRPGRVPYADPLINGHPPKWAPGGAMSHRLKHGSRKNGAQWGNKISGQAERDKDGDLVKRIRPSHQVITREMVQQGYENPAIANPGNLIDIPVGGGLMGDDLAHENEAPFPEELAAWFIRSHCPPGGLVLDPFGGSGSTVAAALKLGRRGVSLDIRPDQCDLARRRLDPARKLRD